MSIDLVGSRVLSVAKIQVDIKGVRHSNSDRVTSRVQEVQEQSAYSDVR